MVVVKLPVNWPITINQGDSWDELGSITLPNFTSLGAPVAGLAECEVTGQIRPSYNSEAVAEIQIEVIDADDRIIRPYLTPDQTQGDDVEGMWELQVSYGDPVTWRKTFFRGEATLNRQIAR